MRIFLKTRLCIILFLLLFISYVSYGDDKTITVDERFPDGVGQLRELFLDDTELVESLDGMEIVAGQAEKVTDEPVLKRDRPWELGTPRYINVLYDDEENTYKMWYQCLTEYVPYGGTPGKQLAMAYALSKDGVHWEKPGLNNIPYSVNPKNIDSTKDNRPSNLLSFSVQTKSNIRAPYVIKDYADPDPAKRYKLLFHLWDFRGRGLGIATSPDGIHWKSPHSYTVMQGGFDTHNIFFWDPQYGCYVAYVRRWQYGKRSIARATSPDCYHWSQETVVEGPDERDGPNENLYTPACFRMKHVRNVYIMVTGVFDSEKDIVTPQLAVSRDGINWSRFRQPFIPHGEEGAWDSGGAWPTATEIPAGDYMLFYYRGNRKAHGDDPDAGVGVARIKRDRFVGLHAGASGGTVTTHPLRLTYRGGRKPERGILTVNADASLGSIQVELLDAQGKTVPGFSVDDCIPMTVDGLDHIIRWKSQPTLYPVFGKPVKMRFHLKDTTVYGFDVLREDPEL